MKIYFVLFLLFFRCNFLYSQKSYLEYSLLSQLDNDSISVYIGKYDFKKDLELIEDIILVFKGNEKTDTITVFSTEYSITLDSFAMKYIYLDKKSVKGLLLTMRYSEFHAIGEGGDHYTNKTINEIFDINKKTMIFSATTNCNFEGHYFGLIDTTYHDYTIEYDYFYNIDFDLGKIKIGDVKRRVENSKQDFPDEFCECVKPDHAKGVYLYRRGRYVKLKSKNGS